MDFLAKLPEFEPWMQGSSLEDAQDSFCYFNHRVANVLCAVAIFWPKFVIKDGLLLRQDAIPQDWDDFMADATRANWSSSQIEYVLNHIHLSDLFLSDPNYRHIDVDTFDFLASTIAEMWKYRLQSLYPDTPVVVEVNEQGVDPEVGVYTMRPGER